MGPLGCWSVEELRASAILCQLLRVLQQTNPISLPSFMIFLLKSVGFPVSLYIVWLSKVK